MQIAGHPKLRGIIDINDPTHAKRVKYVVYGTVYESTLTAPMRHEQAVTSFSVAALAPGPLGHRRSRR
jgi:hypothetical protein